MLDFIPSLLYVGYAPLPWRLLFLFLIFAGFIKSPSILFFALANMDTSAYFSILLMPTYDALGFLIIVYFVILIIVYNEQPQLFSHQDGNRLPQ